MRALFPLVAISLLVLAATAQDTTKHDPLLGHYILANSAEAVCLRDLRGADPPLGLSQRLFDFLKGGEIVTGGFDSIYTNSRGLNDARWLDAVACDVNGDGKDELVTAWAGVSGLFNLSVSSASPPSWNWTESILELPGDTTVAGPIRLVTAKLDTTQRWEIVACYPVKIGGSPAGIMISLFDSVDAASGKLVRFGSELISMPLQEFDLASGDFDGDGLDEIIFVFHFLPPMGNGLLLTVADFPQRRQVSFWPWQPFATDDSLWNNWKRLKITAGDFRHRGINDAVVSVTQCSGDSGRQVFSFVSVDPQLKTFTMDISPATGIVDVPDGWSWGYGWESDAVAEDLNPVKNVRDGEELVVAGPSEVAVLSFNNAGLKPVCITKIPFLHKGLKEPYERRHFLCVADVDADSTSDSWIPEIVLAEHPQDSTTVLETFTVDLDPWNDNEILGLARVATRPLTESTRKSELVMGDFDGDAIRLGPPKLLVRRSFYQPIIELNVPPTHFDTLSGAVYDVSNAYGSNPSQFRVTYSESLSTTSHFSSEVGSSWGISSNAGGGFSFWGIKAKAEVGSSYERGYYQTHSTSTTINANQVTTSWGNDWVLATVCDYDLWEYPLSIGGSFRCGVLVQIPHHKSTEWFDNKDTRALDWTADHEVGNILSYIPQYLIAARTGSKLLTSFYGKSVTSASSQVWSLDLSGQSIQDSVLTNKVGVDVGTSVSGWGMEASLSLDYSGNDITTHTSTATRVAKIRVEVGALAGTIPQVEYTVTPFIYWGANGALVIDYAVDPSVSGSQDTSFWTFWEKNYFSKPDPAFILPWRLDSLKGISSNPNMKLYCKDLQVSPSIVSEGDVVRISATVHNFSLKETDVPVIVRFYLGNPATGGIPIVGTGGLTDVSTIVPVPARDRSTVSTNWLVPPGLDNTARVYAVIDPDYTISEIQRGNNVGFIPLKVIGTTGVGDEPAQSLPGQYSLQQNYPNPFNPTTVILYDVPERSHVTLTVYDILGRTVAKLVDETQSAGRHNVVFNAKGLATGVYLYRLQARSLDGIGGRNFVMTKKMIAIK
jgi:hypothetical protein